MPERFEIDGVVFVIVIVTLSLIFLFYADFYAS